MPGRFRCDSLQNPDEFTAVDGEGAGCKRHDFANVETTERLLTAHALVIPPNVSEAVAYLFDQRLGQR